MTVTAAAVCAAGVLAIAMLAHQLRALHAHVIKHVDRQFSHLEGVIRMSNQDTIAAVVVQLDKARQEILSRISELQEQVAAGVASQDLDLTALTAAAEALDNIADPAPAEPAEPAEPAADPAVEAPADPVA